MLDYKINQQFVKYDGETLELTLLQLMKEMDRRRSVDISIGREVAGKGLDILAELVLYVNKVKNISSSHTQTASELQYYRHKFSQYFSVIELVRQDFDILGLCANVPVTFVLPATHHKVSTTTTAATTTGLPQTGYRYKGACMMMSIHFIKQHLDGVPVLDILRTFERGYPNHFQSLNSTLGFAVTPSVKFINNQLILEGSYALEKIGRYGLRTQQCLNMDAHAIRDEDRCMDKIAQLEPGTYYLITRKPDRLPGHATALIVNPDKSLIFFDPNFGAVRISQSEVRTERFYDFLKRQLEFGWISNLIVMSVKRIFWQNFFGFVEDTLEPRADGKQQAWSFADERTSVTSLATVTEGGGGSVHSLDPPEPLTAAECSRKVDALIRVSETYAVDELEDKDRRARVYGSWFIPAVIALWFA